MKHPALRSLMAAVVVLLAACSSVAPDAVTQAPTRSLTSLPATAASAAAPAAVPPVPGTPTRTPLPSAVPSSTPAPAYPIIPRSLSYLTRVHTLGSGQPFDLRFSPDGSRVALVSSENTCFFDASALDELACLQAPTDRVTHIWRNLASLSDDFRTLATFQTQQGTVWDVEDGTVQSEVVPEGDVRADQSVVFNGALSPDGQFLATLTSAGVQLYRTDGAEVEVFEGQTFYGSSKPFSPDGRSLATYKGRRLSLWSTDDGTLAGEITAEADITGVEWSPRAGFLVMMAGGKTHVYQAPDYRRVWFSSGGAGAVMDVSFSVDERRMALASERTSAVGIWETETWAKVATLDGGAKNGYQRVELSPDGTWLAAISAAWVASSCHWEAGGGLSVWNVTEHQLVHQTPLDAECSFLPILAFSPDSRRLAYGDGYHTSQLNLYDLAAGQVTASRPIAVGMAAAFSAGGQWLASGDGNGRIFLWDTYDWRLVQTFGQGQDLSTKGYTFPAGVAVSPDAQILAAGTVTGKVLLYRRSAPDDPQVLYEGEPVPRRIALSPGGLLAFTTDEGLKVWSVPDQAYLSLPESERKGMQVDGPRFSPDGRYLAAGVYVDNGIYTAVWDMQTGAEPAHIRPSRVPPAFSSDGKTVGTGISPEAGIRLYVSMFPELAPYPHEFPGTGKGDLTGLALSLDGRLAIAAIEHAGWEQMRIEFWKTQEWELAHTLRVNGSESSLFANVLEMSPDGYHLVVGAGAGHALQVWGIRWDGEPE